MEQTNCAGFCLKHFNHIVSRVLSNDSVNVSSTLANSAKKAPHDFSPIQISSIRKTNSSGRKLCNVEGCDLSDQKRGFCTAHFNLFSSFAGECETGECDGSKTEKSDEHDHSEQCHPLKATEQETPYTSHYNVEN